MGANEATSETAVPEGRQAEWNGALSRSEIKRGISSNPSPSTKNAPKGTLFCG